METSKRFLARAEFWLQCLTQMGLDSSAGSAVKQQTPDAAVCKEIDELLHSLQQSWQALSPKDQTSSSPDSLPCPQEDADSIPISDALQEWQLQHIWHAYTPTSLQARDVSTVQQQPSQSSMQTTSAGVWQQEALAVPQLPFKTANQQQTLTNALGQGPQLQDRGSAIQLWSAGAWLWGAQGLLSRVQSLWQHFKHDTQMVST